MVSSVKFILAARVCGVLIWSRTSAYFLTVSLSVEEEVETRQAGLPSGALE